MAADCPVPVDTRMSDGVRAAGLAIFVLATVFFPASLAWWWARRRDPLLRKRHFGLVACSAVGLYSQIVTGALRNYTGLDTFPCDALLVLGFMFIPLAIGPVVVRAILFMNQTLFEEALLRDGEDAEPGSFDAQDFIQGSRTEMLVDLVQYMSRCGCMRGTGVASEPMGEGKSARRMGPVLEDLLPAVSTKTIMTEGGRERNRDKRRQFFLKSGTYALTSQVVITLVALLCVLVIGLRPDGPYFGPDCAGCFIASDDEILLLVYGVVIGLVCVALVWKMRNAPDPLGIKRELQLVLLGGIMIGVGMLLTVIDAGGLFEAEQFNWLLVICLAGLFIFFVQCPLQVWRSRAAELRKGLAKSQGRRPRAGTARLSLSEVLASPDLKRAFQRYLATEWSSENAMFLDVVGSYKSQYEGSTKKSSAVRAVDIFLTFIRDRSMLEVNVSGEVRRKLRAIIIPLQDALTNNPGGVVTENLVPDANVFNEAYEEVYDLVETDSFPRFLQSPQFAELKARGLVALI